MSGAAGSGAGARRRLDTVLGPVTLVARGAGLREVRLDPDPGSRSGPDPGPDAARGTAGSPGSGHSELLDGAAAQLTDWLAGRRRGFDLPLDLEGHPPFRRRVLEALTDVPHGTVVSYGELARRVGRPGAARAVGGACAANPLLIVVPCHRVVAADGGLGGFRAGLPVKRRLLELEREVSSGAGPAVVGASAAVAGAGAGG